jgi:heme/copper-type cytochrome/quinol oxidase subunit 2
MQAGGSARPVSFTPKVGQSGTHFFSCSESTCGTGHDNMLGSIQVSE